MPKVSATTTAKVDDFGVAIDRNDELDGYAFSFVTINEDHSLAPMLSGLPEGRCWCPHWGYIFRGQITVTYADREEVFEAGDAFYMTPGHVPAATKDSEFLQISPAEALNETVAAIRAAMQQK